MKKIVMPILALGILLGSCASEVKVDEKKSENTEKENKEVKDVVVEYTADASASEIKFVGSEVGEDEEHAGTIKLSEGTFTATNGVVTAGSFVIDMISADTGIEKLNGHLAADDMFNMATYPTSTFVINEGSETEIKGTLTTLGVDLPVVLAVTKGEGDVWTAKGTVDYKGTDASTLQHEEGATEYINSVIALEITLVGKKK